MFCSEFPDIPDNAGRKTRRRRRTQTIAKRYALHANAINHELLFSCHDAFKWMQQDYLLMIFKEDWG